MTSPWKRGGWTASPRPVRSAGGASTGRYAEGNALFLKSLLGMIAAEGLRSTSIEPAALRAWYRRRVTEVDAGRLGLVVHQLDLLACRKD